VRKKIKIATLKADAILIILIIFGVQHRTANSVKLTLFLIFL